MLRGLTASVILHASIVASSLIVLPYARAPVEIIEVVPVDIVNISEVTNIAAAKEKIAELPPPQEPEPTPSEPDIEEFLDEVETLPEEAPIEEAPPPPEPKAEEAPEDIVPEEPEEKEPEPEKTEPEPEKDDAPKRDAVDELLDSDVFESEEVLLDRAPQVQEQAVVTPQPVLPEPPKEDRAQEKRRGAGERTGNEARIEALIWAQMRVCWGTVADLPDPEKLSVTVRVNLNPEGKLIGDAELLNPRRRPIGDRFMGQAIDRALRAARKCQPYTFPGDDYEIWKEITMTFRHQD